jgi:hypothetical protein
MTAVHRVIGSKHGSTHSCRYSHNASGAASMASVTHCYKSAVHLMWRINSAASRVCSVPHRFRRRTAPDSRLVRWHTDSASGHR